MKKKQEDRILIENMDEIMTNVVHNMNLELTEFIIEKTNDFQPDFFNKGTFQLELVVDTNILFQEVRSLLINGSSFFLRIIENPFIKVFGPSQLEDELYSKIKLKFPRDKKTKEFEMSECLNKAKMILSLVEINDDISKKEKLRAGKYLNDRDKDDINFVALNFSLKAHGIITNDKDITDQEELKTWKLKDAGRVITSIHKGSMSFLILSSSSSALFKIISYLINTVWNGILSLLKNISQLFRSIANGSIKAISNLPIELVSTLGIAFILIKDLRENVAEYISILWNEIKKIIIFIKELFISIWETFKDVLEAINPFIKDLFEIRKYLIEQSNLAIEELEKLEQMRA